MIIGNLLSLIFGPPYGVTVTLHCRTLLAFSCLQTVHF